MDLSNVDDMYGLLADRLEAVDQAAPTAIGLVHAKHAAKGKEKEEAEKEREKEKERERERAAAAAAKAQLIAQGNTTLKLDEEDRKAGPAAPTVRPPLAPPAPPPPPLAATTLPPTAQPPPPPPPSGPRPITGTPTKESTDGAGAFHVVGSMRRHSLVVVVLAFCLRLSGSGGGGGGAGGLAPLVSPGNGKWQ